jgi:hypothetical protein
MGPTGASFIWVKNYPGNFGLTRYTGRRTGEPALAGARRGVFRRSAARNSLWQEKHLYLRVCVRLEIANSSPVSCRTASSSELQSGHLRRPVRGFLFLSRPRRAKMDILAPFAISTDSAAGSRKFSVKFFSGQTRGIAGCYPPESNGLHPPGCRLPAFSARRS